MQSCAEVLVTAQVWWARGRLLVPLQCAFTQHAAVRRVRATTQVFCCAWVDQRALYHLSTSYCSGKFSRSLLVGQVWDRCAP